MRPPNKKKKKKKRKKNIGEQNLLWVSMKGHALHLQTLPLTAYLFLLSCFPISFLFIIPLFQPLFLPSPSYSYCFYASVHPPSLCYSPLFPALSLPNFVYTPANFLVPGISVVFTTYLSSKMVDRALPLSFPILWYNLKCCFPLSFFLYFYAAIPLKQG